MGQHWTSQFNQQYPSASAEGVRTLSLQFDFTEGDINGDSWVESNPPRLEVEVNGEPVYGLTHGKCTDIICSVRKEQRFLRKIKNQ